MAQQSEASIPRAGKRKWGYDPDQVDEFLEHIRKILNTSVELAIKNGPALPLDPDGHLTLNQVSESGMAQDDSIDTENHFNTKNTRD